MAAEPTLVLDEGMRWMVDFEVAVAAGMAVAIDLDPGTKHIDYVAVVGVSANVAPADAAARLAALIDAHRRSDGAVFIPLGTPTNNLADSPSGYSADDVPPPPPSLAAPLAGLVAAEVAKALGVDPMSLAAVRAADDRELDQAGAMSRALFEATWGTYLRNQAQPNFDLRDDAGGVLPRHGLPARRRPPPDTSTRATAIRSAAGDGARDARVLRAIPAS